jgi:hypothetical protein
MQFTLNPDNPRNTIISAPNGQQVYRVETDNKVTMISRVNGGQLQPVARIARHTMKSDELFLGDSPFELSGSSGYFGRWVSLNILAEAG